MADEGLVRLKAAVLEMLTTMSEPDWCIISWKRGAGSLEMSPRFAASVATLATLVGGKLEWPAKVDLHRRD